MNLIFIAIFLILIAYLTNKYLFSYWTKRDVYQIDPTFLFGNIGMLFTLKCSMGDLFTEFYEKYKNKKFIGAYLLYKPMLIVNDPKLIQDILIKDFTTFHDRQTPADAVENFPLVGNLFNLKGQKWRDLRTKMSPTLTSGKLKLMFPIMRDCGNVLDEFIHKNIENGIKTFDFKDLCARLTINNISSVAFGVENDCINEPENIFRKIGMKIFEPTLRNGLVTVLAFLTPDLFVKLKINPFLKEIEDFVYSLVNQIVDHREKNNVHRNDFMQLMIELKNNGYVSADKNDENEIEWKDENDGDKKVHKFTIDELAAQAFIFFGAGFETSSSTMTFCLFELSRNKEAQRKVHEEIDQVMKSAGPEGITYELISQMKYLDCCIDETLRKYPLVPVLSRMSTKEYQIPGTDVVIEKDTPVFLPFMGLQRDPKIYDDPMAFKPERFLNSPNGNPKVSGIVYAPFGDGPRNCIGARLGKLQSKLGLAMILQKFNFELHDKTMEHGELKFHSNSFILSPIEEIKLDVSCRN